jgi:hypothetical protein
VPNEGVTIEKLIADVKTLMGKQPAEVIPGLSKDEIKGKLTTIAKPDSPFNIDSVKIVLTTVYLNIVKPNGASTYTVEYAFRLDVNADGLLPADIKLFNPERITLAIWNTDDPKVKKQLALSASP